MALTPHQERFCLEYMLDLNGSAAYRRCSPRVSEKVARVGAAKLLAKPDLQARIAELQRAALARSNLTADRVLRELEYVAFQRAGAVFRADGTLKDPREWDEATDATIAGVETEEETEVANATEQQDPQPHGGSLKRTRPTATVTTRTRKVKRWDKVLALKLLMQHFGLLKEAAPHPDRPQFNLTEMTDDQKRLLLAALRSAAGKPSA